MYLSLSGFKQIKPTYFPQNSNQYQQQQESSQYTANHNTYWYLSFLIRLHYCNWDLKAERLCLRG